MSRNHRNQGNRDHDGNGVAYKAGHTKAVEHRENSHHGEHPGELDPILRAFIEPALADDHPARVLPEMPRQVLNLQPQIRERAQPAGVSGAFTGSAKAFQEAFRSLPFVPTSVNATCSRTAL